MFLHQKLKLALEHSKEIEASGIVMGWPTSDAGFTYLILGGRRFMLVTRSRLRKLVLEQLAERIVFHADYDSHEDEPLYTPDGLAYFYDPPAEFISDEGHFSDTEDAWPQGGSPLGSTEGGFHLMDSPGNLDVPVYHSNPSFPKKLYLDFNGHVATGTSWNNRNYNG